MGQCWPGLVIHTMQTGNSVSCELLIRLFLHLESVCMCVRTVLHYHVSGNGGDVHCVRMQGMKEVCTMLDISLMKTTVCSCQNV